MIATRLRRIVLALGIMVAVLAALAFAPARVHASGPIGVKSHYTVSRRIVVVCDLDPSAYTALNIAHGCCLMGG